MHQAAAGDQQARERADQGGQRPAQGQHPAHLHPEQPGHLCVERRGPHLETDVGEAEQRDQQAHHHQHRDDGEDPEPGDRDGHVPDLEAAQPERCREGAVASTEDDRRRGVDDDEQAEGEDDRVDVRLALDRPDHEPLHHGAEHQAGEQGGGEADPVGEAGLDEHQGDVGGDHRHRRLREVDDARGAPDQHQR